MWGKPERLPHPQAAEVLIAAVTHPILDMWNTHPPVAGSSLHAVIEPVVTAAQKLDTSNLRIRPISRMIGLARKASDEMSRGLGDGETADEIVNEMALELKVLVLAARTGHVGIMQAIDTRWGERLKGASMGQPVDALPPYVDVQRIEGREHPTDSTVAFPELLAAAHPGNATFQEFMQQHVVETETVMQRRFAGMWVVTFFTEWEMNYRKRLAVVHDCPERTIKSTLMRDLGYMRNDYAHNRGIGTKKQARCKRLPWFKPGQEMQPMQRHYEQLFAEFEKERAVFVAAPEPIATNRIEFKGHLPQDLVDRFNAAVAKEERGPDEVLENALNDWLTANE